MEKYLLNMPQPLKEFLTNSAKADGYSLNGLILQILWEWVSQQKTK